MASTSSALSLHSVQQGQFKYRARITKNAFDDFCERRNYYSQNYTKKSTTKITFAKRKLFKNPKLLQKFSLQFMENSERKN